MEDGFWRRPQNNADFKGDGVFEPPEGWKRGSLIVVDILHFFLVFLEFKMMPDEFHKNDGF